MRHLNYKISSTLSTKFKKFCPNILLHPTTDTDTEKEISNLPNELIEFIEYILINRIHRIHTY